MSRQVIFENAVYSCHDCGQEVSGRELIDNDEVCPNCGGEAFIHVVLRQRLKVEPPLQRLDEEDVEPEVTEEIPEEHPTRRALITLGVVAAIVIPLFLILNSIIVVPPPSSSVQIDPGPVVIETQPSSSAPVIISGEDVIDIKSVSVFGSVQYVMIGFIAIIVLAGYLDRRQSNQAYDAVIATILALIVVWIGNLPFLRAFFTAIELANPDIIICLIALAVVLTLVFTGGVDFSPLGIFFSIIAIFGGAILSNLGNLQVWLHVPSGPLVTVQKLFELMSAKQWDLAQFSMVVYGCMLIAVFAYGYEILRPTAQGYSGPWGIIISLVGVGIYILCRTAFAAVPVVGTIGGAFLIVVVYNFIVATITRERLTGTGVNWAEYRLGLVKVVSPWDIFAFQAIIGAMLTIAIGKI